MSKKKWVEPRLRFRRQWKKAVNKDKTEFHSIPGLLAKEVKETARDYRHIGELSKRAVGRYGFNLVSWVAPKRSDRMLRRLKSEKRRTQVDYNK